MWQAQFRNWFNLISPAFNISPTFNAIGGCCRPHLDYHRRRPMPPAKAWSEGTDNLTD
jgi:hypothetical protein